jgi:hypothetical protein
MKWYNVQAGLLFILIEAKYKRETFCELQYEFLFM